MTHIVRADTSVKQLQLGETASRRLTVPPVNPSLPSPKPNPKTHGIQSPYSQAKLKLRVRWYCNALLLFALSLSVSGGGMTVPRPPHYLSCIRGRRCSRPAIKPGTNFSLFCTANSTVPSYQGCPRRRLFASWRSLPCTLD